MRPYLLHRLGSAFTVDCAAVKYLRERGGRLAMMTAEEVVKPIAAECVYVDAHGSVAIRLKPAAAIIRAYGEQFRWARPATTARRSTRRTPKAPKLL
jgi:hypothetical protein